MNRLIKFAIAGLIAVGLGVSISNATTIVLGQNRVSWRTGLNTSADTGKVYLTVPDTTAWLTLGEAVDWLGVTGQNNHVVIPDSIFAYFKAINKGVNDSISCAVQVQVRGGVGKNWEGSTEAALSPISGALVTLDTDNADSNTIGFAWNPKFILSSATSGISLGSEYRYIFTGSAGDSTLVVGFTEIKTTVDQ